MTRRSKRVAKWLIGLAVLGVVGAVVVFVGARWLTRGDIDLPDHTPSVENGAYIFAAAGCAGCHTAQDDDATPLAGGRELATPFGTFYGPNITADPAHGIGAWTDEDFVRALAQGVSPDGADYFPVFPYTSFTAMSVGDMLDLKAYIFSLPTDPRPNTGHEVAFPFGFRPALAVWKVLNFEQGPLPDVADRDDVWHRGRYLAAALGHCGECHTPRDMMGARIDDMLLAGTEDGPEGGAVPNITPHEATGIGGWSDGDLRFFFVSGMDPAGDFAGSGMGEVIENTTSALTDADRDALIAYLRALPPIEHQIGAPRQTGSGDDEGAGSGGGEVWE